MAFVNQVVDAVYVINMDKDKERLASIDAQLKAQGIAYERFAAVEGKKVRRSRYLSEFCETLCTDGMKGCAISHRMIWEEMLQRGYKNVLVFEDDAVLCENFNAEFEKAWKQLPKDYDIFYLGCHVKCVESGALANIVNKVVNRPPEEINENILKLDGSWGTHGYLISRGCAEVFNGLATDTHIDLQMEIWTSKFGLDAYSSNPLLVKTDNDEGKKSNLAETYPLVTNSLLRMIPFSDSVTLDWGLSENFAKIGGHNINGLIVIMMGILLLVPVEWSFVMFGWILVEFLVSWDFKNTLKFTTFAMLAVALRLFTLDVVYPTVRTGVRRAVSKMR